MTPLTYTKNLIGSYNIWRGTRLTGTVPTEKEARSRCAKFNRLCQCSGIGYPHSKQALGCTQMDTKLRQSL